VGAFVARHRLEGSIYRIIFGFAAIIAGAAVSTAAPAVVLGAEQQLGKSLFFDKGLSHGGSQSCASCHSPTVAFTDPDSSHATSKGDNRPVRQSQCALGDVHGLQPDLSL